MHRIWGNDPYRRPSARPVHDPSIDGEEMIYLLIGILLLIVGKIYYWLNLNSPFQTRIPLYTLPTGAVLLIVGLARVLP